MATSNGSTAIRDKILASLARYRALRIGKFPCAFWRLSSRPGLTAKADLLMRNISNRDLMRGTTIVDSTDEYQEYLAENIAIRSCN
ncbi:hypothetical protein [Bathymodiolus platifrons methanotrophic gill symbiont]|uniref:hypothetical protein n=1 Tax=Bathymodiolus platifrons methanotrophic gill symbiont TaxID=113268 RepID=UPI001C8DA75B|nr:hypothetical protein [Bathymodiolus platifrons methanotrophic gill symbiont]